MNLPAFYRIKPPTKGTLDSLGQIDYSDQLIETNEPVNSVKSLEIRSAMMRNANGSNSDANSIASIRLETEPNENKQPTMGDNLYKKSLLRRLGSNQIPNASGHGSSGFSGGCLTPRQGRVSLFARMDSMDSFVSKNTPDEVNSPNDVEPHSKPRIRTSSNKRSTFESSDV